MLIHCQPRMSIAVRLWHGSLGGGISRRPSALRLTNLHTNLALLVVLGWRVAIAVRTD
ncbi:hypothetical protein D3C75_616870 [compost metagenome]